MPAPSSSERRREAARVGLFERYGKPDELTEARRRLAELTIADEIRHQVDTAPPLTDDQRARLAGLLWARPSSGLAQ